MKKTLFLTIFAACLSIIAILLFTTGCDSRQEAKVLQQSTEATTETETSTVAKSSEPTTATKPTETTAASTTAETKIDPPAENPAEEYEETYFEDSDQYDHYAEADDVWSDEDSDEEAADNDIDYHPEDLDYPKKEYKHHHTFNILISYEEAECGHIISTHACECGEIYEDEYHTTDSNGNWLLEEVDHWTDYDEDGVAYGENWKYKCPVCGYEETIGTD
ncbi:MAG: hypothetical protein E7233_10990 [Lachnospiraceae bacterium]|nr:hypothetical protein [Lachnospiraceae bacterium]